MLPLDLFRNAIFCVTSALSFLVSLVMLGAMTFMPVYLQVVKGFSATASGLLLASMMAGVLTSSITTGRVMTRVGRYKLFPIIGTALLTAGMAMMTQIDVTTATAYTCASLFVFGLGIDLPLGVLAALTPQATGG